MTVISIKAVQQQMEESGVSPQKAPQGGRFPWQAGGAGVRVKTWASEPASTGHGLLKFVRYLYGP